ncbi:MAG TPA: 50S ribosomal protein L5, partial [Patescibacteria group bacterium]|nr:50S ribosomal protein L5 [Patescibacteria group bacterium]
MTNKIHETKISRLRKKYNDEVAPFLKKELGLTNILACPKLIKVTVNVGTGKIAKQTDVVETAG